MKFRIKNLVIETVKDFNKAIDKMQKYFERELLPKLPKNKKE